MSVGDKHLLFSLCYTPLPQFSLLSSVRDHEYNISGMLDNREDLV